MTNKTNGVGMRFLVSLVVGSGCLAAAAPGRADFTYTDFGPTADVVSLTATGGALVDQGLGVVRLTETAAQQAGAVWHVDRQPVAGGFRVTFDFTMHNVVGPGGSGIAFLIQNGLLGEFELGAPSAGLGYEGITSALAVELDSARSGNGDQGDPYGQHVGILSTGVFPIERNHFTSGLGAAATDLNTILNDGLTHTAVVEYFPGLMDVYVDGRRVVTTRIDLTNIQGDNILDGSGSAYVGFTAATGTGGQETHDILSWHFEQIDAPSATTVALDTSMGRGADTYVRGRLDGTIDVANFGADPVVQVKNQPPDGGANPRKGYFRFDLDAAGVDVSAADSIEFSLFLSGDAEGSCNSTFCTVEPTAFNVYGLIDGHPEELWVEGDGFLDTEREPEAPSDTALDGEPAGEINWTTAPANDTFSGGGDDELEGGGVLHDEVTFLGNFSVLAHGGGSEQVLFSSDALRQFLLDDTNGVATFVVTRVEDQNQLGTIVHSFYSKESETGLAPTIFFRFGDDTPAVLGDLNGDEVVDRQDAAILLRNLGRTDALGQAVDLDGDGNVGLSDLAVIQSRLGVGVPSPTAVPEPSTVLLVLVSVASTAATRVRRRRVQWKRA